jgi:hypothetical protein
MLTAAALSVSNNASVLLRIVARLARLADRMVGGGLLRIVARLDNRARYGARVRAGFLLIASGRIIGSPYHRRPP